MFNLITKWLASTCVLDINETFNQQNASTSICLLYNSIHGAREAAIREFRAGEAVRLILHKIAELLPFQWRR